MDRPLKQANLQAEKILLNKITTSEEGSELFLKNQSYAVVNCIRDLDPDIGRVLKEDIDSLWIKFYDDRINWKPKDKYGGASVIDKEKQKALFSTKLIQTLHEDICETVQNAIDAGELLE